MTEEYNGEVREVMDKIFHKVEQYPVPNPFSGMTFEALQLLTEALFVFSQHEHRMGYDRAEVDRIAQLTNEEEKDEAIRNLTPTMNGPLLTDDEQAIVGFIDHFIMEAMADLEAYEIAKDGMPDIEDFLKNQ